jgi:hypothetical protein
VRTTASPTACVSFLSTCVCPAADCLTHKRVCLAFHPVQVRARDGFGGADSSGEEEQCTNNGGPPTPTAADICHADEATELLKALAAAHPAVARLVQDRAVPLVRANSQRCSIM